ncbi:PREDICTED: uncharacterized protein LOC108363668 [Rhagoletis zephyria]|uniref:uncharacterized protein LOC108363668 n=1 Tax=Rhagoletis zephyria TaxID=28612 RepID=UPI00081180FC|nr:PREDICTED: uncharacterized protein LOC108363668 [Rhagoletis zephyria]
MWRDSTTVISWLNSENRRYKPFVAHRIAEILAVTHPCDWKWVPTSANVAGDATRHSRHIDLSETSRWFKGPEFLSLGVEDWPKHSTETTTAETTTETTTEELSPRPLLILFNSTIFNFNRFSSYNRLKRSTAWVLRFVNRSRRKNSPVEFYGLSASEVNAAEKLLCRVAQEATFPAEITALRVGQPLGSDSTINNLAPFIDDEKILRVGDRLEAATWLPFDCQHPIILPEKHQLTILIVTHYHERMKHQYFEATIGEIRQKFWITRIRQVLRSVVASCIVCRASRAKPSPPILGTLPKDRLTPYVRPFSYTGIDYFGPLNVTIGRRTEKRWIALFTCLTVRAIHLEVAADLSTDSCILTIRNFINRRGVPVRMRSDNGKNFVGVKEEAKRFDEVFDCEQIQTELSKRGIDWVSALITHRKVECGNAWCNALNVSSGTP